MIVRHKHGVQVVGASEYLLGDAGAAFLGSGRLVVVEREPGSQDRVVALALAQ